MRILRNDAGWMLIHGKRLSLCRTHSLAPQKPAAGNGHRATPSAIATGSMANVSPGSFGPWAFVTGQPRHNRHGRMETYRWLAPEQTIVTSSCGLNHLPRKTAFGKL